MEKYLLKAETVLSAEGKAVILQQKTTQDMDRDSIDLASADVAKLFRRYFIPTLLGMLSSCTLIAIDGIFVGHGVGSNGIAAINIVMPALMIITGFTLMIGAGCSVVSSIHISQKKIKAARLNVTQGILAITLFAATLTTIFMTNPDETALILGSSQTLLPMVKEYMMWYAPCWTFIGWSIFSLFIIRVDGSPKVAMMCNVTSAILNIFLDWLFIFPFGWGLKGAAFATCISTIVGSLIAVVYILFFAKYTRITRLKLSLKSLKLSLRNIGYQSKIGSAALLGEAAMGVLTLVGNYVFMDYLGDDGVGAFGIAGYYAPFIFMVGNAVAQSSQPIVSYNYGLGLRERVRDTLKITLYAAAICGVVVSAAFIFFPEFLMALFIDPTTNAGRIGIEGFPYFALSFIPFVINIAIIGFFQSVENVTASTVFAMLRGLIFLVPCFYLLPPVMGDKGIWLAFPLSEMMTLVAIVVWIANKRRTKQAIIK